MNVSQLIEKLLAFRALHGNMDVLIDYAEDGWYELEKVQLLNDGEEYFVNLVSSNEA